MIQTNWTIFRENDGGIFSQQCMMSVRNMTSKLDIIIPKQILNKGITDEDVNRWVEVGNKLIFPATIKEEPENSYDRYISVDNSNNIRLTQLLSGLKIRRRSDGNYKQSDAREVVAGVVNQILSSDRDIFKESLSKSTFGSSYSRIIVNITKAVSHNNRELPQGWYGNIRDFELEETGENLLEYIQRECKPKVEKKQEDPVGSFIVTLDFRKEANKYSYRYHKLAAMSFYRYLWSHYYEGLVKDTLRLIDLGIDEWTAYNAAISKDGTSYYYYYATHNCPGILDIENVKWNLKYRDAKGLNAAFSPATTQRCKWSDNNDELVEFVHQFKATAPKFNPENPPNHKLCINRRLKTLTYNKSYSVEPAGDKFLVQGDDFIYRYYSVRNFSIF